MASRLKLHEEFCQLLGTKNVYYQPPASVLMTYPCIKYTKARPDLKRANDRIYRYTTCYEVTVIDHDIDSEIPDRILNHFSMCSIDRVYPASNLYHFVLTLYY